MIQQSNIAQGLKSPSSSSTSPISMLRGRHAYPHEMEAITSGAARGSNDLRCQSHPVSSCVGFIAGIISESQVFHLPDDDFDLWTRPCKKS